jgi:hypothetical protein
VPCRVEESGGEGLEKREEERRSGLHCRNSFYSGVMYVLACVLCGRPFRTVLTFKM